MPFLVGLIFILIMALYGAAFIFNLPYRLGLSKFSSLVFFAFFFILYFLWPRPEDLIRSDWYMYFNGGSFLLDPGTNAFIFQALICVVGIFIFAFSRSVRKLSEEPLYDTGEQPGTAVNKAGPVPARNRPYSTVKYLGTSVCYSWDLNGGGIIFVPEFLRLVSRKPGKVGHVFEYCSGPGFIGFSLLAHGLCERLTLADVNPDAVEAVRETIRRNHLEDRVAVYLSDGLDSIPPGEQWDLVVGNPPWRLAREDNRNLRVCDPGGRVHGKFFRDAGRHLKPDGSVLFVESFEYTDVDCFRGMLAKNDFKVIEHFRAVSFWDICRHLHEYPGSGMPWALFCRWCLFIREAYFIRSSRAE